MRNTLKEKHWEKLLRLDAIIHQVDFDLTEHPPYSPDFAPSNHRLFPKWVSVEENYVKKTKNIIPL